MKIIRACFALIARFCISLVFLAGAINKIFNWHETERSLHTTLCEWQSSVGFSDGLHDCLAITVRLTPILLLAATLLEFFGGLSVLLGMKEKWGATLLAIFLIPTTIVMHQFWFVEGSMREQQMAHFLKNLAILGGLIIIILQGTGAQQSKIPFPKF